MKVRRGIWIGALLAVALLLTATPTAAQFDDVEYLPFVAGNRPSRIVYVKQDASGANDGRSWENAYTDLQDALAFAFNSDHLLVAQIWVAQGLYTPGTEATDTFRLVDGVSVYGGFAGTETALEQRDWQTNVTVLSGDIDHNDVTDANGIVTDTANIRGTNAYNILTSDGDGVGPAARLDGFTITAGNDARTSTAEFYGGGGLLNPGGDLTLAHLVFTGNFAADRGGGILNLTGSLTLSDVVFAHNATAGSGGAIYNSDGLFMTDVIFTHNSAGQYDGGGIFSNYGNITMNGVTFSQNTAPRGGGLSYGIGMYVSNDTVSLTDVTFVNNTAVVGGGMHIEAGIMRLTEVVFAGNSAEYMGGGLDMAILFRHAFILERVTFVGNTAGTLGGGLSMDLASSASSAIANVAFFQNSAGSGGGAIYNLVGDLRLTNVSMGSNSAGSEGGGILNGSVPITISNSIVWDNTPGQISGSATVSHSDVQGGWPGAGNIDADPLFVDPANGDLHLQPGSPVINLGDNAAVPADVTTDLDGNPRIVGGVVDMGAYEFQGP